MIIDDADLGGSEVGPTEDDAPLVVDADGMKTDEITAERLETVSRRHGEILKDAGTVHLDELAQGDPADRAEAPAFLGEEEFLGLAVGEGLDHGGVQSGSIITSQVTSSISAAEDGVSSARGSIPSRPESRATPARRAKVRLIDSIAASRRRVS